MRNRLLEALNRETGSRVEIHSGSPAPRGFISRWKHVETVVHEESDVVLVTTTDRSNTESPAFAQFKAPSQDNSVLNSLPHITQQTLLELGQVECVYFNFDPDQMTVDVWTILTDTNEATRRAVYEKELELIDAFRTLTFSFRTSDRTGEANPASSDYQRLSRR